MATSPQHALQALLKQQRRRVVAHLARSLGLAHLALAEDAVQTAALRALEVWPAQGVPANPAGWLYRVARHEAIDALRAAGRHDPWPESDDAAEATLPRAPAPSARLSGELDDDELALLFCACHPRLPVASQVALALRALAGLNLGTIAAALLCSEAALAQRLARARESLQPGDLQLPAGHELPARREAVLTALSLAFHAGARARAQAGSAAAGAGAGAGAGAAADAAGAGAAADAAGAGAAADAAGAGAAADAAVASAAGTTAHNTTRTATAATGPHPATSLCWEAIRLARALAAHPAAAHADADALAAMLLLHGARLSGQLDDAGHIVLLPGQPRDRWDGGLIRMGLQHLQAAQRASALSRWHLLAGIAAEHAVAPDAASTNWAAIAGTYETLLQLDPSAAPRLGHAIAWAEAGEAAQALQWLQALQPQLPRALQPHGLAAQARAHERMGHRSQALQLLEQAAAAAPHPADARALRQRVLQLVASGPGTVEPAAQPPLKTSTLQP